MKHIDNNIAVTRRRLMRRVWYSYALSLVESGAFVHGLLLGGVVAGFGRLTHVVAIANNLLEVPVGSVPAYVWQSIITALSGGEVLTVLVTILLVLLSVGAMVRLGSTLTHLHIRAAA